MDINKNVKHSKDQLFYKKYKRKGNYSTRKRGKNRKYKLFYKKWKKNRKDNNSTRNRKGI